MAERSEVVERMRRAAGPGVCVLDDVFGDHPDLVGLLRSAANAPSAVLHVGPRSYRGPNRIRTRLIEDLMRLVGLAVVERHASAVHTVWRVVPEDITRPDVSVTVVIPCRNEVGNIAECIERVPEMGTHTERLVIDGDSTDGTWEAVEAMVAAGKHPGLRLMAQTERVGSAPASGMLALGKGDATRKAFAAASGDIVMILDADMTVAPEDLPPFYEALRDGRCDLANGARLVYPHHDGAFRPANLFGNHVLRGAVSAVVGKRLADTLCGTKALWQKDTARVFEAADRLLPTDPFGDFDILMGAAACSLSMLDIPVKYHERVAGDSKVSVRRHGGSMLRLAAAGMQSIAVPRWMESLR